jgi:hypothetical protein
LAFGDLKEDADAGAAAVGVADARAHRLAANSIIRATMLRNNIN